MESQPNILRHANTMPPQGLAHQRSVVRKPVGRPVVSTPIAQTTLVHRPAPHQQQQQQYSSGGYPPNNQQQQTQQQLPQSYHPGQHVNPVYPQQSPQLVNHSLPAAQPIQSVPQQPQPTQGQHLQHSQPQAIQHQQAHHPPQQFHHQQSQVQQQQQQTLPQHLAQTQHPQQQSVQQQSPIPQQQTQTQHQYPQNHQPPSQHQIPGQSPQPQQFSPIGSAPNITSQTPQPTLANTHQTPPPPQPQPQPQATPASPAPQAHHNDPGYNHIANSFVTEHGRPASISSSPSIATPATTISSIATPSVIGTPTWEPTTIPPPIQQTPAVDIRRTSTGQPSLCNHCRKAIPLNVSVYTCLICSTAHIATNFCVWCFTSNAVNTSHSHDKSYYATESDPRVQPSVQDATTHMWTIRKNVSGRLWYTHNATGLKTHLKPTAAALSGFSGLPPGWDERRTPDGRTFYFNKRMGTSAWTKPANSLPEGWKELRTPDAVPFYVNEQLGLSTWDRPGQQPKQQTKNKVVVRRARPVPGQPNIPQNVGDNLLSATINAARLTGQGVESASRQVGKLGKRKNWRKLGRMLNQVNGLTGDNSGSDCEYNDYNDDGGFGFGDDQQQGQFQQSFDYQQSFGDQSQQSFDLGDNQQQSMFQQPAYEQQTTFEYSIQTGQPEFDPSAFQQQPEQFSITTEVSYSTTEPQPMLEQQPYEPQQDQYVQQTYEQQSSVEIQQQTTYESIPAQDPIPTDASQQVESFEPVPPQQVECQPPPVSQESYVQPMQQTYSTQQYTYDSTQGPQMIQQEVTVSYQVPTYEPALTFVPQAQPQQLVYPVYIPNNQPEIITSDDHLVEVPGIPDTTTLNLSSGYGGNDILAGTSLAAEQNSVVTQAPQDDVVVKVTIEQSQSPALGTACGPEPAVVQEYATAGKTETVVSVDAVVAENNFDVSERCLALI